MRNRLKMCGAAGVRIQAKTISSISVRVCYNVKLTTRSGGGVILKICVLASSSAGNSTFVGNGGTRILIDAGLSCKEILEKLAAIGECIEALDAVLLSHEHSDHTSGLAPVLRKSKAPLFATHFTAPTLTWGKCQPEIRCFQAGERLSIGSLSVETFTVPHDAIDPVGFAVSDGSVRACVVTDLGYVPESVKFHLRSADFVLLESNHDLDMLKVGPYPWSVKQRVMGRNGHLSNAMVSDFIVDGLDSCVRTLVLAHLSEQNNHPAIAEVSAAHALRRRGGHAELFVSHPRVQSQVWEL